MNADKTRKRPQVCHLCRHFYITYEPVHPYGCNATGFMTSHHPCETVFASSGLPFQMFEA
ncbi:MAG: uracil-DNA glycosylase [Deltaproteobacteria bacterium]